MNEKEKIFYANTSYMLNNFFNSTKSKSSFSVNSSIPSKVSKNSNISEITIDKIQLKREQSEIKPLTQRTLKRPGVEKYYKQAIKYYQPAAEKGDADAQYRIGTSYMICYKNGEGIIQDDKKAFKYYQMAADQGHAKAQYILGVCYDRGEGVAQDVNQAVKYYQLAADQGIARAQYNLANCYKYGEGITKDIKKSFKYYQMAADQGHAKAQYKLGVCYDRGKGVAHDYKQAVKYYQMAAEQGHAGAKEALALLQKQKINNITFGTSVNFYKKTTFELDRNFPIVEKEKNENVNYSNYQRVVMCK